MAIENAQLYEEARDRARRLEAVRAITTAILAGIDTGELLGLVVGHARELVGADVATLALPGEPSASDRSGRRALRRGCGAALPGGGR